MTWAAPFPSRTWAIEGAEGLGFLRGDDSFQASFEIGPSVPIDPVPNQARKGLPG